MDGTGTSLSSTVLLFLLSAAVPLGQVVGTPEGYDYGVNHDAYYDPYITPSVVKVEKVVDYYSRPQYTFGYEVDAYYNQLSHGRWETRDGDVTQGQYRVLLPDGRTQIVRYIADKAGYRPTIEYIQKGSVPPPPPSYAHVKVPHFLEAAPAAPFANPVEAAFPIVATPTPAILPSAILTAPPALSLSTGYSPFIQDYQPVQIKVNSLPTNGPLQLVDPYAVGYGYGLDQPFASSNNVNKISRKRALLYDRTLFRKDVERRTPSGKNKN